MGKTTKDGLPVVSKEMFDSLISYSGREVGMGVPLRNSLYDELRKENPLVANIIDLTLKSQGEGEFYGGVFLGVTLAYKLLQGQAASNKLEMELSNE